MTDPITVMVADDHLLFRDGIRTLLMGFEDMLLIAEAETGGQAVALAEEHQPNVILMDIQMPDLSGIEATRRIVHTSPHIAVLMVTMFDDDQSVFSAMRAGARGYVLKGVKHDELLRAIHVVAHGEAIFSADIARRMMDFFSRVGTGDSAHLFPELTERERYILSLIAQGKDNDDISAELDLSLKTVRNHVSNILNKLQVTDRSQAILKARQAGMGDLL
jgi:DNA-binding NarL/FixJ family response regulator